MDAYSEDLRKKIVQALRERRMNKSEAARAFGVSLSSVKHATPRRRAKDARSRRGRLRARNPYSMRRPGDSSKPT
jgi:transposase